MKPGIIQDAAQPLLQTGIPVQVNFREGDIAFRGIRRHRADRMQRNRITDTLPALGEAFLVQHRAESGLPSANRPCHNG